MSAEDILLTFIVLFLVGIVVTVANYADKKNSSRMQQITKVLLGLFNILIVLSSLMQVSSAYSSNSSDAPEKGAAWGALLVSVLVSGGATLLLLLPVRRKLTILFPRYQKQKNQPELPELAANAPVLFSDPALDLQAYPKSTPLFPQMLNYYTVDSALGLRALPSRPEGVATDGGSVSAVYSGFNPASTVHMVALVLCVYMFGLQMVNFILGGGLKGVADSYQGGLTAWDLLINALPFVVISIVGVGLGVRRDGMQTLKRLGLGKPSVEGLVVSSAATIGLFFFVIIVTMIWMGLVSKETFKQQTEASDALSSSISTIGLAFLLAATAAVGEELAFRGALQPIFGLWPTAIIFALTHAQYTFTPASLIILGVALTFGWIRQRYNTTVAMVIHFLYDFIPLAIAVAASQGALIGLLRLLI